MEGLDQGYTWLSALLIVVLSVFEWLRGCYREGKKNLADWKMAFISSAGVFAVERPLMVLCVYFGMLAFFPAYEGQLGWLEQQHLLPCIIAFILVDEWLHGWAHHFTHRRRPPQRWLAKLQAFYRGAHRAHHMNGGNDGRGDG